MKYRHQRNFRILQHTINHKVAEMNRISIQPCRKTLFEKLRFIFSYAEDWQIYFIINLFLAYYEKGDASFTIRPDHSIHKHQRFYYSMGMIHLINGFIAVTISESILLIQIKTNGGTEQIVPFRIVRN